MPTTELRVSVTTERLFTHSDGSAFSEDEHNQEVLNEIDTIFQDTLPEGWKIEVKLL